MGESERFKLFPDLENHTKSCRLLVDFLESEADEFIFSYEGIDNEKHYFISDVGFIANLLLLSSVSAIELQVLGNGWSISADSYPVAEYAKELEFAFRLYGVKGSAIERIRDLATSIAALNGQQL